MNDSQNREQKSKEEAFAILAKSVSGIGVLIILLLIIAVIFSLNLNQSGKVVSTADPNDLPKKEKVVNIPAEQLERYDHGENLYKSNCASCHAVKRRLIGPKLAGVTDKYEREWLYKWIRNNNALRASGDTKAIAVYEEYNGSPMNLFLQLTEADIDDILLYIEVQAGI